VVRETVVVHRQPLARAMNLLIARGAYHSAAKKYLVDHSNNKDLASETLCQVISD
jgi:hypothetical protein